MKELSVALITIFCTPFGWIGMLAFGYMVSMIRKG